VYTLPTCSYADKRKRKRRKRKKEEEKGKENEGNAGYYRKKKNFQDLHTAFPLMEIKSDKIAKKKRNA
jgi:hypothetical protein